MDYTMVPSAAIRINATSGVQGTFRERPSGVSIRLFPLKLTKSTRAKVAFAISTSAIIAASFLPQNTDLSYCSFLLGVYGTKGEKRNVFEAKEKRKEDGNIKERTSNADLRRGEDFSCAHETYEKENS